MGKRADLDDSDSDGVIVVKPRAHASTDDEAPSPARPSKGPTTKGKAQAAAVLAPRPSSSRSKPPPQVAGRRPPPQQTASSRRPTHPSASSPARPAPSSSNSRRAALSSDEGEEEFSLPKSAPRPSSSRSAGGRSVSSSSAKRPTPASAKGKGKAKATPAPAPPPKEPAPTNSPAVVRSKAPPGWKGYVVPEPGKVIEAPAPSQGYMSGLDQLWQQGMFNPFQDGEPLKKSLRSGRQVRSIKDRWGDDDDNEAQEDVEMEEEGQDAPVESAERPHDSAGGHNAQEEAMPGTVEVPNSEDETFVEVVQKSSSRKEGEGVVASPSKVKLADLDQDTDDSRGRSLSFDPISLPDSNGTSPFPAIQPPAPAPPPAPAAANAVSAAGPSTKLTFRKISRPESAAPSSQPAHSPVKVDLNLTRLVGRSEHRASSPPLNHQRPPSPVKAPAPSKRKAVNLEPAEVKRLRSNLRPPPGVSPPPRRPQVAQNDQREEEDSAEDNVADLSFYPQIQVDFEAEPDVEDDAASLPAVAEENLVHLAKTKSLVLAQLSGHAPPLTSAQSTTEDPLADNAESLKNLTELLRGTSEKGEGNSCLVQGVRGSGKTAILNQALAQLGSSSIADEYEAPHVIRLSALVQKDDKAAIKDIGRQFGLQDQDEDKEAGDDGQSTLAPTTLPAHLLAILTAPSKRAIIIVLEEFDVFASFGRGGRQMLLYCLLDVVQSIRPSLGGLSGRGVAVVGVSSRLDTLHLLEKRVKSRFSHRIIRIVSPFNGDKSEAAKKSRDRAIETSAEHDDEHEPPRWRATLVRALVPWQLWEEAGPDGEGDWRGAWRDSVEHLLSSSSIQTGLERLTWLTSDVRVLLRVFVLPVLRLSSKYPFLTSSVVQKSLAEQAEGAGWGKDMRKFKTLSLPCLAVLAAVKDLGERGIHEFNFEHAFFTYGEFAKARLVGTGKARFSRLVMKDAFNQLAQTAIIFPTASGASSTSQSFSTSASDFAKHRCAVSPYDIVELFRGPAGKGVMSQLASWGRKYDI